MRRRWLPIAGVCAWLVFGVFALLSAEERSVGKIVHLRPEVEILRASGKIWEKAVVGRSLGPGDAVRTGPEGRAAVLMADETLLRLNGATQVTMAEVAPSAGWLSLRRIAPAAWHTLRSTYQMLRGEIWFQNKNRDAAIDIVTPRVSMGVRGTEANIRVAPDESVVLTVLEGRIKAWNDLGSLDVYAREQAVARPGEAPQKRILVTPEDAVQWVLTIPRFVTVRGMAQEGADRDALERSIRRLEAGEVAEAERSLRELVARKPRSAEAWSLLSVVHLVRGEKAGAMEAAKRATDLSPDSADPWLARGYVHQAAFDLDGATLAVRRAVTLDDQNVLALANLARLLFGSDRLGEAWETIKTAGEIDPANAEVHNVRGFILLAQRRVEEAMLAFARAADLDSSLGEPHLGLALSHMRQGDVASAMEAMSTAVLLEPRRSLFLSYWAKMLYQLERFPQALDLLESARSLDPQDPTPWLYQAIILRDLNRPTEAIQAMNRAVALDDNRAVYRSRFLLDRDLAVKNVGLSILYSDLGLSAWAKNKALASVKEDYANHAGHLFYGGALFGIEGRGRAAVNESLLARILMPANVNSFNSFNEYTSFFEKPSISGVATGVAGTQDTYGGNLTAYGAVPEANLAFSASGFYDETKGWRKDNFSRSSDVIGMLKWDPTPNDGVMVLASHPDSKFGDIGFEVDRPLDPYNWFRDRITRVEAAYHHHFAPHSDLLVYFTRVKEDASGLFHSTFQVPPREFEVFDRMDRTLPFWQGQIQQNFKVGDHQFLLGTLQSAGRSGQEVETRAFFRFFGQRTALPVLHQGRDVDSRFESYYIQDTWRVAPWLTVEAAGYFERLNAFNLFTGAKWKVEEFEPRLGIILTPTPADTIRLAAFRYLIPNFSFRLDPSDVAGVTIFRNALEGSVAEEADLVWEHEWASGFFSANVFYLERKLSEKLLTSGGTDMVDTWGRMRGVEVAVNQILWKGLGFAAGYRFLNVDDENLPDTNRLDHLFSVGLQYVHPCGISAGISQLYRHEDMKGGNGADEDIWITDVGVGYIFPGRKGSASFLVRNLFDQRFNWVRDLFIFEGRAPAREIIGTVTWNF
jgi:Flp pilus assembly protein TadD